MYQCKAVGSHHYQKRKSFKSSAENSLKLGIYECKIHYISTIPIKSTIKPTELSVNIIDMPMISLLWSGHEAVC